MHRPCLAAAKAKRSNYPNVYLEFNCGGDDDNEYDEAHCCASVGWISTTNTYHSDGFTDCTAGTDHYSTWYFTFAVLVVSWN